MKDYILYGFAAVFLIMWFAGFMIYNWDSSIHILFLVGIGLLIFQLIREDKKS